MVTKFDINYAPVYASQSAVAVSKSAEFSHEQTCRPKFSVNPSIDDMVLADDGTLTVSFN
jgi:hypothetical protein